MLFVLLCTDKPNSAALRGELRPEHLAYLDGHRESVKLAGPFLTDDGEKPIGSMLVIEAVNAAAANAFAANDPYAQGGLFSSVEIKPWRWTVNAPKG
jgi:uncharacterized protein YciI